MTVQYSMLASKNRTSRYLLAGLLVVTGFAAAQDTTSQNQPHQWRRADDVSTAAPTYPDQSQNQAPPPPPNFNANQNNGQSPAQPAYQTQPYPNQPYPNQPYPNQPYPNQPAVPATLTIRPGTYVSVRINQLLSSDRNQKGDTFFASLAEPIVVDGVVVAQRGQTVRGRVTDAQKAGRVEGTSKLGVELIGLTLVDGQQVGMQSQMVTRNGQTSVGRDAGAVGTTTALGAIIGAGAGDGRGAAIGAGAGAAAGIIGVLLTRGRPSVIYPESLITFQMQSPVTVATDRAPQAFRYAEQSDYGHGGYSARQGPPAGAPVPVYRPAYDPYYYGPAYSPYYWGPGLSVYVGPRFSYGYYGGFRGFRR